MREISLTQNNIAIVDDEDFDYLNQWNWCTGNDGNGNKYAFRGQWQNGKYKTIRMHRDVLRLGIHDEKLVDHKNHNVFDNRKQNLRLCNKSENNFNKSKSWGFSKYKGVAWRKDLKKWGAYIGFNKKQKHLGYFENELDAAAAYDLAALKYFGEFAFTNFENSLLN